MSYELMRSAEESKQILIEMARKNANCFCEYVIKDERTNKRILQSPVHEEWHDLADKHDRLLIWSHVESGKTTNISVARTLYELGRDPTLRIAIVSNTHRQAEKILSTISRYIENSVELKEVFPHLKKSVPWTTGHITVERPTTSKDPSVQVCGIGGNITGARLDLLIIDDILDPENTSTSQQRDKTFDWIKAVLFGRLTENARIYTVGTAYHPDDVLHRFAKEPRWTARRFPIVDEKGVTRWPKQWPQRRVEEKRAELGPLESARQLECRARDDSTSVFKKEWIDNALLRGRGRSFIPTLVGTTLPKGCKIYSGVDLAVSKKAKADRTVITTILIWPNLHREILFIEAGRWSGQEIIDRIVSTHQRYNSILIVENNAAQDYLRQFVSSSTNVPIVPHTTGKNKSDSQFGIESIATELSNSKWIFPSGDGKLHPELTSLISQMLYYNPHNHTGDNLMSLWFARELSRRFERNVGGGANVTIRSFGGKQQKGTNTNVP